MYAYYIYRERYIYIYVIMDSSIDWLVGLYYEHIVHRLYIYTDGMTMCIRTYIYIYIYIERETYRYRYR